MLATIGIVDVIIAAENNGGICENRGNIQRMDMRFPSQLKRDMFIMCLNKEGITTVGSKGIDQAILWIDCTG